MKTACLLLALLACPAFLCRASAEGSAPTDVKAVLFDKAGFVKQLPKKTLVYPKFMQETKGAPVPDRDFWLGLRTLGSAPGIAFIELPETVTRPKAMTEVAPVVPRADAPDRPTHEDYLVLIASTGNVAAIYSPSDSYDPLALEGARALVQWSFLPSTFEGKSVPVLVLVRIPFGAPSH
jgi:hypothetical protein